ncbi:hypothetical protein [Amycolatopsis granulosa]|nr:hypothetical protein [Amycolatopsis granulosa]NIH83188.1 hypothetical protein [Amycolatopsis granulosa]
MSTVWMSLFAEAVVATGAAAALTRWSARRCRPSANSRRTCR